MRIIINLVIHDTENDCHLQYFFKFLKIQKNCGNYVAYLKYYLLLKGFNMKTAKSSLEAANQVVPKIE